MLAVSPHIFLYIKIHTICNRLRKKQTIVVRKISNVDSLLHREKCLKNWERTERLRLESQLLKYEDLKDRARAKIANLTNIVHELTEENEKLKSERIRHATEEIVSDQ